MTPHAPTPIAAAAIIAQIVASADCETESLARLYREGQARFLKLLREILREVDLRLLALGAPLFQRLDVLFVRGAQRHRDLAREEKIAGVASADFDLIAFAAEAFDGFDEENFCVSHGRV